VGGVTAGSAATHALSALFAWADQATEREIHLHARPATLAQRRDAVSRKGAENRRVPLPLLLAGEQHCRPFDRERANPQPHAPKNLGHTGLTPVDACVAATSVELECLWTWSDRRRSGFCA
jgi:hypothetical protein